MRRVLRGGKEGREEECRVDSLSPSGEHLVLTSDAWIVSMTAVATSQQLE